MTKRVILCLLGALAAPAPAVANEQTDAFVTALTAVCAPQVLTGSMPLALVDELPSFMASNFLKPQDIKGYAYRLKGVGSVTILVSKETPLCAVTTQQADMSVAQAALSEWQRVQGFEGNIPDMKSDAEATLKGNGLTAVISVKPGNGQIALRLQPEGK